MTVVPQAFMVTSQSRQWLAVLAVGEEKAPKEAFFTNLSDCNNKELKMQCDGVENNEKVDKVITGNNVELMVTDDSEDFKENFVEDNAAVMTKVQEATESILKAAARFGNKDFLEPLNKIIQNMNSVTSTNSFNSQLHSIGSAVRRGGAGRGKIPCQPTSVSRRANGRPRGAAPLCKGWRPAGAATAASKRARNLAENVNKNLANAKSHVSGH